MSLRTLLFICSSNPSLAKPIGVPNALTTRLVPQKNHETLESRAQLKDALLNACDNAEFCQLHLTTPFGFKETDGKDTSINPIWRHSLYQVILVNPWAYNATVEEKRAAYARGSKAVNFLRDITPGSGAYLVRRIFALYQLQGLLMWIFVPQNEADIHEPNHEGTWPTYFIILFNSFLKLSSLFLGRQLCETARY